MAANEFSQQHEQALAQFGQLGHEWIGTGDGTTTAGVIYHVIKAPEPATISYTDSVTGTAHSSKSIPAGFSIEGLLEQISVSAGNIIAFKGGFNR